MPFSSTIQKRAFYFIPYNGGYRGFYPALYRYIDDDFAVVVLTNYEFGTTDDLCQQLAKIALEKAYEMPTKPTVFPLSPQILEGYLGKYGDDDALEFKQEEEVLFIVNEGTAFLVYPMSETTFHYTQLDSKFEVMKDEDGTHSIWGCKKKQFKGATKEISNIEISQLPTF